MNRNPPRKTSMLSKGSQDSFPVRLNASNVSESSEDHKSNNEFGTPEEVEQLYKDLFKNVKTNSNNPQVTSISQRSKQTNPQDIKKEVQKDWATTPLYEEYERSGKNVYRNQNTTKYYTEEEVLQVYEFVKNRYDKKENDKSVISFYKKAMDTLFLLTDDQLDFNTYRKIQSMYSKVDVTNTLKLLLRCSLVYQARRQIVEIFENIRIFKILRSKAKNMISLHLDFKGEVAQTTQKLVKICKELETCQKLVLENIVSFLKNHKLFGNKSFIFEKKEWLSYSIKEYRKIRNNALKVGIKMKDIKELEAR